MSAPDLRPAEVAEGPRLDRASFYDDDLDARVTRAYADDLALLARARGPA